MPKRRGDWCDALDNGGPLPNVRACKEARVRMFVRHPRCSLKSVDSAGHRKVISITEERGKSEESSQPMLCDRALRVLQGRSRGLALRQLHMHIALSKQYQTRSTEHFGARSKHQPRLDERRNSQIKRNQVKSGDQKRTGHTQIM